jgi:hypothetical protein
MADLKPGTWAQNGRQTWVMCPHVHYPEYGRGHQMELVCVLDRRGKLARGWKIDAQGNVEPAVRFLQAKCQFKALLTLDGWAPPAAPGGKA